LQVWLALCKKPHPTLNPDHSCYQLQKICQCSRLWEHCSAAVLNKWTDSCLYLQWRKPCHI
jgi:hypothetical protein